MTASQHPAGAVTVLFLKGKTNVTGFGEITSFRHSPSLTHKLGYCWLLLMHTAKHIGIGGGIQREAVGGPEPSDFKLRHYQEFMAIHMNCDLQHRKKLPRDSLIHNHKNYHKLLYLMNFLLWPNQTSKPISTRRSSLRSSPEVRAFNRPGTPFSNGMLWS